MRVIFTEVADRSFGDIQNFLRQLWTQREMETFVNDTEKVVQRLKLGQYKHFQKSKFNTRSAHIGKRHVRMYFRKSGDTITVLLFFDVRQNPENISAFLK